MSHTWCSDQMTSSPQDVSPDALARRRRRPASSRDVGPELLKTGPHFPLTSTYNRDHVNFVSTRHGESNANNSADTQQLLPCSHTTQSISDTSGRRRPRQVSGTMISRDSRSPSPPPSRETDDDSSSSQSFEWSAMHQDQENRQQPLAGTNSATITGTVGVANAALVARGALKSGYLWKMGANVPRWKRRYFVLKPITMLFYYMSEHDTEPRGCIDLDLFNAVRRVGPIQQDQDRDGGRAGGGAAPAGRDGGVSSRRTTFELYRSGSPEGSGFMLEARGHEDWEHWVETIANGRHGKMQAEADVLKGTNKLLLEEIRGLEQQVETFRGYADQRHVTVLVLRDERQRNRDLIMELHALRDEAEALSQYIKASGGSSANRASHSQQETLHFDRLQDAGSRDEEGDIGMMKDGAGGHQLSTLSFPQSSPSLAPSPRRESSASSFPVAYGLLSPFSATGNDAIGDGARAGVDIDHHGNRYTTNTRHFDIDDAATVSTMSASEGESSRHGLSTTTAAAAVPFLPSSLPNKNHDNVNDDDDAKSACEQDESAVSFEALRAALTCARVELERRDLLMRREGEARRMVEGRVNAAVEAARIAEERTKAAEAAAARAKGRVSVLERNVEYLQMQQQGLRAELYQSKQRAQRERVHKTVLKKELLDLWTPQQQQQQQRASSADKKRGSANPVPMGYHAATSHQHHRPLRPRCSTTSSIPSSSSLPRSRTMGDLLDAEAATRAASSECYNASAELQEQQHERPPARLREGSAMVRAVVGSGGGGGVGEVFARFSEVGKVERGVVMPGGGTIRSSLSRGSLAGASDGGDTDMAEQSVSETSDEEYVRDEGAGSTTQLKTRGGPDSQQDEPSPLGVSIRQTIRRHVGHPDVPPLPPPRQQRILEAAKRLPVTAALDVNTPVHPPQRSNSPAIASNGGGGGRDSLAASISLPIPPIGGGGGGGVGNPALGSGGAPGGGLAVAGLLLSGLGKGMVEKATQGVIGRKLWVAGSSVASGATAAGFGGSNSGGGAVSSESSPPRMRASRSAASLPDYAQLAVRWGLASGGNGSGGVSVDPRSMEGAKRGGGSPSPPSMLESFTPAAAAAGVMNNAAPVARLPVGYGGIVIGGGVGGGGGGGMPPTAVPRRALIQLSDLELDEACGGGVEKGSADSVDCMFSAGSANMLQPMNRDAYNNKNNNGDANPVSLGGERRFGEEVQQTSKLPRRPDETYELVFESRVLGLQIHEGPDDRNVTVSGREGYTGPAQSGSFLPRPSGGSAKGPILRPEIGDILEYYNGCSTEGMSPDLLARELATCERPLKLGFRSARPALSTTAGHTDSPIFKSNEFTEESEEEGSLCGGYDGAGTSSGPCGGGGSGGGGRTCAAAQGGMMGGGEGLWREAMRSTPQWGLSG